MDSLVGYGSDDEVETDRYRHHPSVSHGGRRKEDDTNYEEVNMDMSEESQGAESEPELPPADARDTRKPSREERRASDDSRDRDRDRDRERSREQDREREPSEKRDRRRERERYERERHERERRSPRRDDRHSRDRMDRSRHNGMRRGPDRVDPKNPANEGRGYGGEAPYDARDAASPRFVERDRRDRDRERERDRDSRHSRRSEERRAGRDRPEERSRSRGAAFPPPHSLINDRRNSPPSGDYRPSSYKVNKKLEVMEKMGLQIKTPDGSMATAQQLRAAAGDAPHGAPTYCSGSLAASKILDQVQKRKLLWANKEKAVAEAEAAKWSGARFSQDSDGRQVSKFMRLMGIKDPAAVKTETAPDTTADPNKKQEELFQAMQAQYEVARATTHTMRGVGLGFQRGNF